MVETDFRMGVDNSWLYSAKVQSIPLIKEREGERERDRETERDRERERNREREKMRSKEN